MAEDMGRPSPVACGACVVGLPPASASAAPLSEARLVLSVPGIHCTACIATVERVLTAVPGVHGARVNLTLRRASVAADPGVGADDLITALDRSGYEAHELDPGTIEATGTDQAGRDLLMRVGVAGFAMMNVMLLSVAVWSGAENATRDLFHWLSAAIALPAIVFSGQPFFRSAWGALRGRRLNMDVPIVLAIVLAAGTSLYETAHGGAHAYFDAAITLTFFLLAGRFLDHRTRAVARSAAAELSALEVPRAIRLQDGVRETVAVADLSAGDRIVVLPGGRMPVDGMIEIGESELDRSVLSGETLPVLARPGMMVSAGEVNLTGVLTVRATAVGRDTSLHALADLVAVAESGRAQYSSLADKAAKLYAPGVHILALLSFAGWFVATRDMRTAVNIAAAVLIITCPCALGLAVPAVTTAASGRLFRQGLLLKNATALERLAEADLVVFDKTGTLTSGLQLVSDLTEMTADDRAVALALAEASSHPLSRALAEALRATGVNAAALNGLEEIPGSGVRARLGDAEIRLGRADWTGATETEADMPSAATWLKLGDGPARCFAFSDRIRPGAAEAVTGLRTRGLRVVLLSGDAPVPVADLAAKLGIEEWQARVSPVDKADTIAALTGQGHRVLMVGDGLNDTAALAAAHVSISPATALDAARVASDIVLLGNDLSTIVPARDVAIRAVRRIRENFQIATFYNVLAVPLAVAGLATPLIAALAMSSSSVTVSLNALRLGRVGKG
ncbi:MAG: heavy metal translocating P-type ATPase [Qingshengfaniella sp.]